VIPLIPPGIDSNLLSYTLFKYRTSNTCFGFYIYRTTSSGLELAWRISLDRALSLYPRESWYIQEYTLLRNQVYIQLQTSTPYRQLL
jgi:hypothetical protein